MVKKRIVVKIGSSSLTEKDGTLSPLKLAKFCHAFAEVKKSGHELIVVSSGSVAAGFREIGYSSRPKTVRAKQAAAAVGQSLLMQQYRFSLQQYGITPAQMLLTKHDFRNAEHYQNIFESLSELLKRGILPIINENDSTAVDELTFGDNDMLSALISGVTHADMLILMTDIDGIYNANPISDPHAEKYTMIHKISEELFDQTDTSTTAVGTGGMRAKLQAAKAAQKMGTAVYIGTFTESETFAHIAGFRGGGTYIVPEKEKQMQTYKQWIAYHASSHGSITVDDGAAEALLNEGSSLLLVGVQQIEGKFDKGEVVNVYSSAGTLIGKGKAADRSEELQHLKSLSSPPSSLVVHRDFWVSLHNSNVKEGRYI
ncbi:glutamate 5-kinase [Alkalicoccus halolimnae]|uniref:Glutamate 5-kinase n=1 Tax=Alkalicoccus halolimnae TaxID=1667239 RepID=A0A5C7FPD9_9BACI|nr:glutamate 5-kinase [Alkalicoccus halolimnae]TXF87226.1 glutamate 5-kinase [Alkalicoccus halolimnae]